MLALLATVVSIAALFGLISTRWLKLPIVVGTMLLTVLLSVGLLAVSTVYPEVRLHALATLAQIKYETLILHGLLSLLLFAGSFLFDIKALAEEKLAVGVLAIFGTASSTVLTCAGLYYASAWFGLQLPFLECLLFASLISPTDPIAVLEMLRRIAAPPYLQAQLAGESLFNDGIGAVLFLTTLGIAESGKVPSLSHVGSALALQAGGGLLLGVVLAWPVARLMRTVSAYQVDLLLTLTLALGGYALAEAFGLSAPLEAVSAGLALQWQGRRDSTNIARKEINHFWASIDEVQNSILFVLMGLEVLAVQLRWSSLVLGTFSIVLVNSARFVTVACVLALLRLLTPGIRTSLPVLAWGGLRGGLSIALALSLPANLGHDWIFATTYTVVVFSIVVKGGTMERFLKRFGPTSELAS